MGYTTVEQEEGRPELMAIIKQAENQVEIPSHEGTSDLSQTWKQQT